MAGKRKSDGIALLSLYKDEGDEEEEEDDDEAEEEEAEEGEQQKNQSVQENQLEKFLAFPHERHPHEETAVESVSTHVSIEVSETLIVSDFHVAPRQDDMSSSTPVADQLGNGAHGIIVDYAHDDAALSPDAEEGEITSMGRAVFGLGLKASNGATPPSTRSTMMLDNVQLDDPSQTPGQEQAAMTPTAMDVEMNDSMVLDTARPDDDALADFLPPPPTERCSEELQNKFARYLALKEAGRSFNEDLRKSKGYRNPDFLQRAVMYQEIDQIGSCFKKEIFDPHGYDPSDFYDTLALEFKREQERKEQAKKQSQRIEFSQGGVQAPSGSMLPDKAKPALPVPSEQKGSSVSASASVDMLVAASQVTSESASKLDSSRSNKKSKWDKVDDVRVPPVLPSTVAKPALAATNAHAAFAVASAGGGYASFAQQKRKEAEERSKWER